jgi:hypothetical protein
MQNTASDLSAKLLATENLSVVRARTRTASFDIKSRVLTLPMWKEMTPQVEDMLIGHEVGHALYTTDEYTAPIMENNKLMGYMNIIEDVRIEKLIKRKYPGLRKRMNEGYKQLNDRDFFGVKSIQNFDDLLLIDKINLYFKVGFNCGVKFTPDEKQFVNRAERCETIQEVIELAKDIYAYSKEKAEERKQNMQQQGLDSDESEEEDMDPIFSDFDPDMDDTEEVEEEQQEQETSTKQKATKQNDDPASDEDLESKTDRSFKTKLDDLADESTEYTYWKFDNDFIYEPLIGYKRVLSETKTPDQWDVEDNYDYLTRYMNDVELKEFRDAARKDFEVFKTESMRTVNYLVKEFEMKKSAQMYKRAQVSKIGSLDMRKVYAYKIKDDLFKRVTTLPQGKNHGMIMLVDWSGSMNNVLQDTLKQVINLAMFCNRAQIPYRVLAFTSCYEDGLHKRISPDQYQDYMRKIHAHRQSKVSRPEPYLDTAHGFHLIELFSNKMTTSEFNSMSRRVLDYRFLWNTGYNTGGTPLTEAIVWVYNNIGSYIKNNGIEKMTFITLTDGSGGALTAFGGRRLDDTRSEVIDNKYVRIKTKHFIKDAVTQKTYEFGRDSTTQTDVVLQMIKDRYGVSLVGFHICRNHKSDLREVIFSNIPNYKGDPYSLIESMRKEFREQDFASIKNTGRDELFIIPQSSTKIVEGDLHIDSEANAKSIAKNFGKFLNVKKTSRILLNRFVSLVA